MTGRHAGLPAPSDIWLQDQCAAWVEQFDTHAARLLATGGPDDPMADVITRARWIMDRQCELLLTARQLIEEALNRG